MKERLNILALLTRLLLVVLILGAVAVSASCSLPYRWVGDYRYGSFESNGERIYFTAESSSGESIAYSGGAQMMMHQRTACVNCHGQQGRGGRVTMMMWRFDVPDITWDKLTQEQHHEEEPDEEEHEEHSPYTEETLKKAITRGINPAGGTLEEFRPRWQMSGQDLDDLVEFIKTL